jgi:hypothetical protein
MIASFEPWVPVEIKEETKSDHNLQLVTRAVTTGCVERYHNVFMIMRAPSVSNRLQKIASSSNATTFVFQPFFNPEWCVFITEDINV